ncbi:hypothetical protein [Paraferrimonas sp. SM1919]|uniref:hypothetical protein n=1 Tax=Paraferrimonas sp. SM1919 TaxID=2662263 RepID=UPI0013D40CBB|nr:hypothetical protein [Paraferrimonas sp. SM1919]
MKVMPLIRKVHKWLGLLLGLQVIFWVGGGLIMSSIPLEMVHGKHLHGDKSLARVTDHSQLAEVQPLLAKHSANSVQVYQVENTPVYEIANGKQRHFYNAITTEPFNGVNQAQLTAIATRLYQKSGQIKAAYPVPATAEAIGLKGTIWRIDFDDWMNTSFYLAQENGQLLRVRSDLWRIFDFVWMLHIMDYEHREDFNNPLLISFAALALLFSFSGVWLLLPWLRSMKR